MSSPPRRARVQQGFAFQTGVLTSRYVKTFTRDTRHLRGALLQAPLLGVLTALLFAHSVFEHNPARLAGKSAQLIFLMTMIASWLGAVGAAREIVKERSVLARELAVGVRLESYLASKVVVLGALVTAQIACFAAVVILMRPLHEPPGAYLTLGVILLLTGYVAVLLGLLVSASTRSEDQATGIIPLMLVPQLLLSGAIVAIADMTIVMKVLSAFIPTRWSFAAAGDALGLNERIASDKVFAPVSRYGHDFFNVPFPLFVLISAAFATAFIFGTAWQLRASRRP